VVVTRTRDGLGKWFLADTTALSHEIQLVCFPHSGGCASTYREWFAELSSFTDVLPVQLPGRETRIREPFVTDMRMLVDQLADVLLKADFRQVALFGHSMGAVIALKVCEALEQAGIKAAHLFVSGHEAPPSPPRILGSRPEVPFAVPPDASDTTLMSSLAALDPSLADWLASSEMRNMFLPVLRADMRLLYSAPLGGERIDAPVTVLAGCEDPYLRDYDLAHWARVTRADCVTHWLPGHHFYLGSQGPALARLIRDRLAVSSGGG
jgi:surfactin synthase thioesterase subunit